MISNKIVFCKKTKYIDGKRHFIEGKFYVLYYSSIFASLVIDERGMLSSFTYDGELFFPNNPLFDEHFIVTEYFPFSELLTQIK